jgi:hypothetical protein
MMFNLLTVLACEDVKADLHALWTMTEQFQLCEWGYCHLWKMHNIWIMGCTWLHNFMYSLAVIRPWSIIMGPTKYCTTILLSKPPQNLPHVPLLELGILDCRLPWVFSKRNSMKEDSSNITHAFPVAWCPGFMVMTPLFTHLSITFSNQRFSNCCPTVNVAFVKLTSFSFCGNRVFKMNIQFCCSRSVIFETIFLSVRWSPVIVDSCPLFLFADAGFPFVYADIISETVTLDTPNTLLQMLQVNVHQGSVLFQNQSSPPFTDSFTWTITQHNHYCIDMSITEHKQREEHSVLLTEFISMYPTLILFFNFLVFPLVCPPL